MQATPRILIVDDDPEIRTMLGEYLSGHQMQVREASSAFEVRESLAQSIPDVVLLDIGLPGEDGLSVARYIRERHNIGIIIVSGADATVDKVVGLEVGADDYITKPFDLRELLARLKSVCRRYLHDAQYTTASRVNPESVHFGRCRVDTAARQLLDEDGREVPITSMEYELIQVFLENPRQALSRDELMNKTRNRDWDPYDRSIDIRIARLRKKIEPDPDKPLTIKTIRGRGYMYIPAGES